MSFRSLLRGPTGRLIALVTVLAFAASACGLIGGESPYTIQVELSRSFNLFPGSPVRVLGVDVGKVSDVHVDPERETVLVDLVIDGTRDLPAEASAIVIPQSLLGERYVQIFPPYTGGGTLEEGSTIPVDRTTVPAEFDEVLESLNKFVSGIDDKEFARFVTNLATAVEGRGEELGKTIDSASLAVDILRENDQDIVALATRLSDLNDTLNTRTDAIGLIIEDWNTATRSLADDREELDAALNGLVRITEQLSGVLGAHRGNLQEDIETLTRVGRTASRNLDQVALLILSSAELFRHATRVIDFEKNWLPLLNHDSELPAALADTLAARLNGLCINLGVPGASCEQILVDGTLPTDLCIPGIIECPEGGGTPLGEAVEGVVTQVPELGNALTPGQPPTTPALPPPGVPPVTNPLPGSSPSPSPAPGGGSPIGGGNGGGLLP